MARAAQLSCPAATVGGSSRPGVVNRVFECCEPPAGAIRRTEPRARATGCIGGYIRAHYPAVAHREPILIALGRSAGADSGEVLDAGRPRDSSVYSNPH